MKDKSNKHTKSLKEIPLTNQVLSMWPLLKSSLYDITEYMEEEEEEEQYCYSLLT